MLWKVVTGLGGFPLDHSNNRQKDFCQQATQLLQANEILGVFPKGAVHIVKFTKK